VRANLEFAASVLAVGLIVVPALTVLVAALMVGDWVLTVSGLGLGLGLLWVARWAVGSWRAGR
jgi:hypothetical protein